MTDSTRTHLSWCPVGMGIRNTQGDITLSPVTYEQDEILPHIVDTGKRFDCIYLPMEQLLVRHFSFPLKHTRFLDAAMLAQDLADTAGIEPESWWLAWAAKTDTQGIAGLLFGLPKAHKNAIQQGSTWQHTPFLLVDGWERLNSWLLDNNDDVAVVDTDAEGVFFGYYNKHGIWQGMRRLNADMLDDTPPEKLTKEILLSLTSMGVELGNTPFLGRITPQLEACFALSNNNENLSIESNLEQRHIYNLKLASPNNKTKTALNLRHGKWSAKNKHRISHAWYRTITLTALTCMLWLGATSWQNHQLQQQLNAMNDEVIQAFHRGLPQQTVIIDAMAQLRQAANQDGGNTSANAHRVTQQLNIISEVFKEYTWHMQELKITAKEVVISGQVNSLDTLNNINNTLTTKTGHKTKIADTDLNGDKVTFRIRW